jgi:hypothetical protein
MWSYCQWVILPTPQFPSWPFAGLLPRHKAQCCRESLALLAVMETRVVLFSASTGLGGKLCADPITETNWIHSVLCGMQSRTFVPSLAAIHRISNSVVSGTDGAKHAVLLDIRQGRMMMCRPATGAGQGCGAAAALRKGCQAAGTKRRRCSSERVV